METRQEKTIRELFTFSVLLKGAFSLVEVVGGFLILLIPPSFVVRVAELATQGELSEDPSDALSNYLLNTAHAFSVGTEIFIAIYLVSRGVIKLGLVAGLLKNKLWAYPASLVVLGLFVIYQCYQIYTGQSVFIVSGLTLFDLIVIYFIWCEWRIVEKHLKERTVAESAT